MPQRIISPYRNGHHLQKGRKKPFRFVYFVGIAICLFLIHNTFNFTSDSEISNRPASVQKSPFLFREIEVTQPTINKEKDTAISNKYKFSRSHFGDSPDDVDTTGLGRVVEKNTETHKTKPLLSSLRNDPDDVDATGQGRIVEKQDITPDVPAKPEIKEESSVPSGINPFIDLGKTEYEGQIKSINFLGERNSGTTWIFDHLFECFNSSVPVRRRLKRYKHWFQDENIPINEIVNGTLVVAMFRNVYDWTRAMMATPHNAPMHMNLEWKDFLTKKWTMERVGKDLNVTEEQKKDPLFCQEGFLYNDVVSCHRKPYLKDEHKKPVFSSDKPFYEMRPDGSGEPFDNILEMRAAKISNMLEAKDFAGVYDYWILKYEDLLQFGTAELVKQVEKMTGVKTNCTAFPKQQKSPRPLQPGMSEYLTENVDWDTERLVGYFPGMKLESIKRSRD